MLKKQAHDGHQPLRQGADARSVNAMQKTTYTLIEAASLLSCHKETLRRAIAAGDLRAARLGREFRISRIDLQTFWNTHGGGELFDKADIPAFDAPPAATPEMKARPKQPQGPLQLPLLG